MLTGVRLPSKQQCPGQTDTNTICSRSSAPLLFTANDGLDFGIDLGSPVGLEYYDLAPFLFNGTIENASVKYLGTVAEGKKEN